MPFSSLLPGNRNWFIAKPAEHKLYRWAALQKVKSAPFPKALISLTAAFHSTQLSSSLVTCIRSFEPSSEQRDSDLQECHTTFMQTALQFLDSCNVEIFHAILLTFKIVSTIENLNQKFFIYFLFNFFFSQYERNTTLWFHLNPFLVRIGHAWCFSLTFFPWEKFTSFFFFCENS